MHKTVAIKIWLGGNDLSYTMQILEERKIPLHIQNHSTALVFIDPQDSGWKFNGPLETDEFASHTFARAGQLDLTNFENSGADWLPEFKQFINDGKTIVASPHKVFGPQTNDLVLQLRKRSISKIILGGMLANMCVESHLREFLEQGFEIAVVKDAVAGPRHPSFGDGYQAALINYQYLAHAVLSTSETLEQMMRGKS
ncbi:hypothetical protein BH11CYA1_BH11CYA1_18170 [soil metagenome]